MIIPSSLVRGSRTLPPTWIVLTVLVAFGGLTGCGNDDESSTSSAETATARAEQLEKAGKFFEAATALEKDLAATNGDDKARTLERVAQLYHQAKDYKRSLATANRALATKDEGRPSENLLFLRGDSLRRLQKPAEATEALESVVSMNPQNYDAALSLASLRFRGADAKSALELFEQYFQRAPKNHARQGEARLEYGRALRRARRFQEAADQFMNLLEADPSDRQYYSELSQTLYRMRLREQGKFVEGLYRGLSERAFEEYAQEGLMKAGRIGIALAQTALNRSHHRDYASALRLYQEAMANDPHDVRIPIYYSDLCIIMHRYSDAREAIAKYLGRKPKLDSGLHAARARVELAAGRPDEAANACRRALKAAQTEGDAGGPIRGQVSKRDAALDLAEASILLERHTDARTLLAKWPSDAQNLPPARVSYLRGRLAILDKQPALAQTFFGQAEATRGGDSPELKCWKLVPALLLSPDQTRSVLKTVLEQMPVHPEQRFLCQTIIDNPTTDTESRNLADERLGRIESFEARRSAIDKALQSKPYDQCAKEYEQLGDLYMAVSDMRCFTHYLLAADLDEKNARVAKVLLNGLRAHNDYFVRLRLLRRLLALSPNEHVVIREIAEKYLTLHVKLGEAESLARRFHTMQPSVDSYELLTRVLQVQEKKDEAKKLATEGVARYPQSKILLGVVSSP